MNDKIISFGEDTISANDIFNKDDLLDAIVSNWLHWSKLHAEDILWESDEKTALAALRMFYTNIYALLDQEGFTVQLSEEWKWVTCLTQQWWTTFRVELEKDDSNGHNIDIILKIGSHLFATIKSGNFILNENIPDAIDQTKWKMHSVIWTEYELLRNTFLNTQYIGTRKNDIKIALWFAKKEEINVYIDLVIDYNRLRRIIWKWWINITKQFIEKYWNIHFLKIMKRLLS